MIAYLRRVIAQGTEESSRRFAVVVATLVFSACDLILCGGIAGGVATTGAAEAVWGISIALAGMAGYSYTRGPAPSDGVGATTLPPQPQDAATGQPAASVKDGV